MAGLQASLADLVGGHLALDEPSAPFETANWDTFTQEAGYSIKGHRDRALPAAGPS